MRFPPVHEFFLLGRTLKSHGTSGQLRLMIDDHLKSYARAGTYIFLDLDGSRVPYEITDAEDGQHFVIRLEGVDDKQASDLLASKNIWIPIAVVKPRHLASPRHLQERWEDYQILQVSTGETYQILRTEEYPQQLMAIILLHGKEIMIPLHEQLIASIDPASKTIRMDIPEGLLEL